MNDMQIIGSVHSEQPSPRKDIILSASEHTESYYLAAKMSKNGTVDISPKTTEQQNFFLTGVNP